MRFASILTMVTPFSGAKITGVLLFALGIILVWFSAFLYFAVLPILDKLSVLADDQQYMLNHLLSGTIGSLVVAGIFALGVTDIIIAMGVIKQKKWAWKALTILTIVTASLNILAIIGVQNTAGVIMIIGGLILKCWFIFFMYPKTNQFNQNTQHNQIKQKI